MSAPSRAGHRTDDIVLVLHSNLAKLVRQLRTVELPPGMTPERISTLASIHARGPISVKRLAALENVQPASMSRMISSLADIGLVRRGKDKNDKRGVLVSATAKGRRAYARANQQYLKRLNEALNELEPQQVALLRALASILNDLTSALDSKSEH